MINKRENLRVVILDDNEIALKSFKMLLDVKGVDLGSISLAATGEEALNCISSIITNLPDSTLLVLLDHNLSPREKMAGVNGETIATEIKDIAPKAIIAGISSDTQLYIEPEKRIGFDARILTAILDEISPIV